MMQTDRQKEIIKVALDLIAQKGIQGLTIKNIANSIGISEPAIYRHYENKTHILIAILDFFISSTAQIFAKEFKSDSNAIDKIDRLFTNHYASFSKTPSLVAVVFSEELFRNETILIDKISEIMHKNNEILLNILLSGQKNNEIRNDVDVKYLAVIIMGSLRLFVKKWELSGYSFNLNKEGKKLVESMKLLIRK